jgi:very-short-patch-repair endonuclease
MDKRETRNYSSLPFNPKLKERAKELRKTGVLSEVLLWSYLKNGQLSGLDFDRQKIIGNYIVDFYCPSRQFVIEIDGASHDENKWSYDQRRDDFLKNLGLTVIHLSDNDVKKNMAEVIEYLKKILMESD